MRLALFALLLSACAALLADAGPKAAKAPKVRRVDSLGSLPRDNKKKLGEIDKPTKITSDAELKKAVPDDKAREKIAKAVDFKSEYLLLLTWRGSSADSLTFRVDKNGDVTFHRVPGYAALGWDHAVLYALPKKAKYTIGKDKEADEK